MSERVPVGVPVGVPEGASPEGAAPEGAAPEGAAPEGAAPEGAVPVDVAASSLEDPLSARISWKMASTSPPPGKFLTASVSKPLFQGSAMPLMMAGLRRMVATRASRRENEVCMLAVWKLRDVKCDKIPELDRNGRWSDGVGWLSDADDGNFLGRFWID